MKAKIRKQKEKGKPALELVEEGIMLVRNAPPALLVTYYLGAIPFVLGLLYFLAEMGGGGSARASCAPGALALAVLLLFKQVMQCRYASGLFDFASNRPETTWNRARWIRCAVQQTLLQPMKLFLLPVAAISAFPMAWALAYYQGLYCTADGSHKDAAAAHRAAMSGAFLWPGQNHVMLLWFSLLGIVVWADVVVLIVMTPSLIKMFFGIESVFTLGGFAFMNLTFLAAEIGLVYLLLDPLFKAIYVIRSHDAASQHSGEDVRVDILEMRKRNKMPLAAALIATLFFSSLGPLRAENSPPPASPTVSIEPAPLDKAMQEVIKRRKYQWRLPREEAPEREEGMIAQFSKEVGKTFRDTIRGIITAADHAIEAIKKFLEQFFKPQDKNKPKNNKPVDWLSLLTSARMITTVVLVILAGVLLWFFWRKYRDRKRTRVVEAVGETALSIPDIEDEQVIASQLPEEGWLKMGRELLAKGETRLAIRAFYLACLAHLAANGTLVIAKHKTNGDYSGELVRRARGRTDLHEAFRKNVRIFERTWYGIHEVTAESVEEFNRNIERIRTHAA